MQKTMCLGIVFVLIAAASYGGDQNVNININVNQSQGYSGGSSSVPDRSGYKIVYSHVHQFQGGYPIDVPLPGVNGGFLRLEMQQLGFSLRGGLLHPSSRATTHEMVNAGQIARDQPRMPCMLGEWTYRAVDTDGSLLGVLVTMVNPQLWNAYNTATQWNEAKMNPVLRVTIWRQQ